MLVDHDALFWCVLLGILFVACLIAIGPVHKKN